MKKNVRKFFGGLLTFALLTGFYSCSNGSSSDDDIADLPQNITQDIYSGDLITFTATKDSKSSNDVNIILKYDRSEKGAKEQLVLSNVELEVNVNNSKINMPDKIIFNLEPYSSLDSNYKEGTEETRSEYQKEYKVKLPLHKKISAGDKITLQLKSAQLGGEGLGKVAPEAIVTALIDNSEAANWYTELCEDEYQSSLITKKNGKGLNEKETQANSENTEKPAESPAETPATVSNCKEFVVKTKEDISDSSIIGFLLQTDNDESQDANGLKIDITNLELSVKVGNNDAVSVKKDKVTLIPNEYADSKYSKSDIRFRLNLTGEIKKDTEITIQIKNANILNSEKKDAIIFALQKDDDDYGMIAEDEYIWKNPFEVEEK